MSIDAAKPEMEKAYAAGTAALAGHCETFDSLKDIAMTVVDAAAPVIERRKVTDVRENETAKALRFIRENRNTLIRALIDQARWDAANGKGAEKGFYDSEIARAADWLETLL